MLKKIVGSDVFIVFTFEELADKSIRISEPMVYVDVMCYLCVCHKPQKLRSCQVLG